jgi:periplasmic divalent cation tolerance protein
MSPSASVVVCFSTVERSEQARHIAAELVRRRVAACVQIDGPIESHYVWEGKVCSDPEYRLVIKSSADTAGRLRDVLREIHPYDVPQIVTVPCIDVDPDYAAWVRQNSGAAEGDDSMR